MWNWMQVSVKPILCCSPELRYWWVWLEPGHKDSASREILKYSGDNFSSVPWMPVQSYPWSNPLHISETRISFHGADTDAMVNLFTVQRQPKTPYMGSVRYQAGWGSFICIMVRIRDLLLIVLPTEFSSTNQAFSMCPLKLSLRDGICLNV